jgi:hypothetical protein
VNEIINTWESIQRTTQLKEKGYDTVTCNEDAILYFDHTEQEVCIEYPVNNDPFTITMAKIDKQIYQYNLIYNTAKQSFTYTKPIQKIGSTTRDGLFKLFVDKIMALNGIPTTIKGQPEWKVQYIISRFGELTSNEIRLIESTLKSWEQHNKTANKKSWFEVAGTYDTFNHTIQTEANNLLLQNNFIDYVYDVIHLKVVGQKPKAILAFLIALSCIFDKALNSVVTGSPGKSKSTISETVFEIFPEQRKIEMDLETTESGLLNMTKFKEGAKIFKHKLIKLGDAGDDKEQEKSKFLLSVFKVLMSEQKYTKILTDMQDEEGKATVLKILGCGSVNLQVVTPGVESQFQSRSIVWSPDDNKYVQNSIKDYQLDELGRKRKEHRFRYKREVIACCVDKLFSFVENLKLKGDHEKCNVCFDVLNPFTNHMNALFQVDNSPNANRDRLMIQMIPKLVTLANSFRRELWFNKLYNEYVLIVTPQDYLYTVETLGKTLSHFIHKKSEALQTYTTMIESDFLDESMKHLQNVYRRKYGLEIELQGKKTHNLLTRETIEKCFDEEEKGMEEDRELLHEMKHFSYKQITKKTTANKKTVTKYIQELDELGILYVDKSVKEHRVYIPSDYFELKDEAFNDIFDFKHAMSEENEPNWDVDAISLLKDESKIDDLYNSFINGMENDGYVKIDISQYLNLTAETTEVEGLV